MEQLFGIPTLWLALGLALVLLVLLGVVAYFANRHRFLFKLGVRNVPRRKAQSVLIVMGLMLSTTIIASSLGIGDTVTHSIRVDAFTALGHTDEIISSPEAELFGELSSRRVHLIRFRALLVQMIRLMALCLRLTHSL